MVESEPTAAEVLEQEIADLKARSEAGEGLTYFYTKI